MKHIFRQLHLPLFLRKESFDYKTLRFFCDWVLQIKFDHFEKKWFCDSLVIKRHPIAHGERDEGDTIDIGDCIKWHEETIKFMDDLKDAILLNAPNSR